MDCADRAQRGDETVCRWRGAGAGPGQRPGGSRGGGGGDGAVGQRQVHAAEPGGRAGQAVGRDGHGGRAADRHAGGDQDRPVPAHPGGHGLPVLQPGRGPDRGRKRDAAGPAGRGAAPGGQGAGRTSCWPSWASTGTGTPTRPGCPAGSGSGWRSPGRWSTTRRCCWPMSRPARWTPPRAGRSGSCCVDLNAAGQTLLIVTHNPELAAAVRQPGDPARRRAGHQRHRRGACRTAASPVRRHGRERGREGRTGAAGRLGGGSPPPGAVPGRPRGTGRLLRGGPDRPDPVRRRQRGICRRGRGHARRGPGRDHQRSQGHRQPAGGDPAPARSDPGRRALPGDHDHRRRERRRDGRQPPARDEADRGRPGLPVWPAR